MKKNIFALALVVWGLFACAPQAGAARVPTQEQAYEAIMAMQEDYPDGSRWTSANQYSWKGGGYGKARGCMAFAHMLSDAAFGDLPARKETNITIDDVRVGDVLRNGWDSHSVIVIEVHESHVVVAEGNWNYCVRWGRTWSAAEVAAASYLLTRYPENYGQVSGEACQRVVSDTLSRHSAIELEEGARQTDEVRCLSDLYHRSRIGAVELED